MKRIFLVFILSLFTCKSYAQVYHNDLQLGISAGTVFGSSGCGVQGSAELKFLKHLSISYRALTSDAVLFAGLFSSSKSYREQAMLIGFHIPVAPSRHQLFLKVGPGSFVQSFSTDLLLYSESNTLKGHLTVFEAGYSYEYKAMDLQAMLTYGSNTASSETPVTLGVRIGLDPLYWILPQKKD